MVFCGRSFSFSHCGFHKSLVNNEPLKCLSPADNRLHGQASIHRPGYNRAVVHSHCMLIDELFQHLVRLCVSLSSQLSVKSELCIVFVSPVLPAGPGVPFNPGPPDGPLAPASPRGPLEPGSPLAPSFPKRRKQSWVIIETLSGWIERFYINRKATMVRIYRLCQEDHRAPFHPEDLRRKHDFIDNTHHNNTFTIIRCVIAN